MKLLSSILIVFSTSIALACPNLTGTFTCEDEHNTFDIAVGQSTEGVVTTYSITADNKTDEVIADNQERTVTDEFGTATVRALCEDSGLKIYSNEKAWLDENKKDAAVLDLVSNFSLNSDSHLAITHAGTYIEAGRNYVVDLKFVCTRK